MFALKSNITIKTADKVYSNIKPIDVKITKSIHEYADKAIIKLPITSRLVQAGKVVSQTTETAKRFEEGNEVTIKLGYNDKEKLEVEFTGFISRINLTDPVELECEGYSYQLRKNKYEGTYTNKPLKDLLQILVKGTDIKLLTDYIPDYKVDKILLGKDTEVHNGVQCLDKITEISKNTIHFFFDGNELYAGMIGLKQEKVIADKPKNFVKYKLGWNVIKDGNLKLRQTANDDITINMVGEKKDGTKVKVTKVKPAKSKQGVKTKVISVKSHAVTDEASLKMMADSKLAQESYDGYEGKITAFGVPFCQHNWIADLADEKYPDRSGQYLIESVEVSYNRSGFRRVVGIALKLQDSVQIDKSQLESSRQDSTLKK